MAKSDDEARKIFREQMFFEERGSSGGILERLFNKVSSILAKTRTKNNV